MKVPLITQILFLRVLAVSLFFIVCLPLRTQAQFEICNQTTVTTNLATVYLDGQTWHSIGWYPIKTGACFNVLPEEITSRYLYVHGEEAGGNRTWGNGKSFCVDPANKFDIPTNQACPADRLRPFTEIDAGEQKQYRFTLTCTDCPPGNPTIDFFGDPVKGGHSPLDTELLLGAIHSQWTREREALLAGANPNITDRGGQPFLLWHMQTDQTLANLQLLVGHGADVNTRDTTSGVTPLMEAWYPDTVAFLVSAGAKLEARDKEGLTPLFQALRRWSSLQTSVPPTDNGPFTANGVNALVIKLLSLGANPNAKNDNGENTLFYFARMEHEFRQGCSCPEPDPTTIVQALVRAGANPNSTLTIANLGFGSLALRLDEYPAFYYPSQRMLEALINSGMSPDPMLTLPYFSNIQQACPDCAAYLQRAYSSRSFFAPAQPQPLPSTPAAVPSSSSEKPDWQKHIDWASSNGDAGSKVDCPADYLARYPECFLAGGRSCLMSKARQAATANNCEWAMELVLLTQCHSREAQRSFGLAGTGQVCHYLGQALGAPTVSAPPSSAPRRQSQPWPWPSPATAPNNRPSGSHARISVTVENIGAFDHNFNVHDNVCNEDKTVSLAAHQSTSISLCSSGALTDGYASFKAKEAENATWTDFDLIRNGEKRSLN